MSVVGVDISESVKSKLREECPNCPLRGASVSSVKCCRRLVRESNDGASEEFELEEIVSRRSLVMSVFELEISVSSSFVSSFLSSSP